MGTRRAPGQTYTSKQPSPASSTRCAQRNARCTTCTQGMALETFYTLCHYAWKASSPVCPITATTAATAGTTAYMAQRPSHPRRAPNTVIAQHVFAHVTSRAHLDLACVRMHYCSHHVHLASLLCSTRHCHDATCRIRPQNPSQCEESYNFSPTMQHRHEFGMFM
jgi:hypothetical protein